MKRLSLHLAHHLLTAALIACACVCMNLLLYRTGATAHGCPQLIYDAVSARQ